MALESKFPFVKMVTAENFIGFSDNGKVNEINKIFNDSYKSPLSVIVLDDIERLMEFIHIGPRFSNAVLQSLLVLIKKIPPYKDRRLLIIGTTSMADTLQEFELVDAFNVTQSIPILATEEEIFTVLDKYPGSQDEKQKIATSFENKPGVGIKYLMLTCEMALQKGKGSLTSVNFEQCYKEMVRK